MIEPDAMSRAARGYVERLDFALVVADASKRPLTKFFPNGVKSATRNLELIDRALRSCNGATLAARVGGHVVLDVDTRHGGPAQLERLEAGLGRLPCTWREVTPTGGEHIWFRGVETPLRGRISRGVEVLRGNRLVTLSPSQRAGGRYRWLIHPLETAIAEAPQWLLDLARLPELPSVPRGEYADTPAQRERRAAAYMSAVDGAISGSSGHARTFLAAQILVRGFALEPGRALALLTEWNRTCCPPWSARDLRHKIKDAIRNGRMPFGALLADRRAA